MSYQAHPAAECLPLLEGAAFAELVEDICARGLREPIVLKGELVLDGRNRLRACEAAGVEPRFRQYEGEDLVEFVVSANLKRRHLNESQRAMCAARLANMKQGARTDLAQICARSQTEAAELFQTSRRSLQHAAAVQEQGAPELVAAVDAGAVRVSAASDLATLPKDEQREVVARGEKEILNKAREIRAERAEKRREERVERMREQTRPAAPLDSQPQRYSLIYADPPWQYEHAVSVSREIEEQYPTMTLEEIQALPVGRIAAQDCVLAMWATSPKLGEALSVLDAWGFEYRTCAAWVKHAIGMGYYFRQQHELLLVATRGNPPAPGVKARVSSVIDTRREAHSKKPDVVYTVLENWYPGIDRLELFARQQRDGWHAWGNQASA